MRMTNRAFEMFMFAGALAFGTAWQWFSLEVWKSPGWMAVLILPSAPILVGLFRMREKG